MDLAQKLRIIAEARATVARLDQREVYQPPAGGVLLARMARLPEPQPQPQEDEPTDHERARAHAEAWEAWTREQIEERLEAERVMIIEAVGQAFEMFDEALVQQQKVFDRAVAELDARHRVAIAELAVRVSELSIAVAGGKPVLDLPAWPSKSRPVN